MEKNEGALEPNFGDFGRWTIDPKRCTTCCECIDACLLGLLYFFEEKKLVLIKDEDGCTQCGDCASACAYDAIALT